MMEELTDNERPVNCRVGSLENEGNRLYLTNVVNCRVGSLEIQGNL